MHACTYLATLYPAQPLPKTTSFSLSRTLLLAKPRTACSRQLGQYRLGLGPPRDMGAIRGISTETSRGVSMRLERHLYPLRCGRRARP